MPVSPYPTMTQPCLACSAVADPGVLNRAEWIKFVATFYNKEDIANDLFATTSKVRVCTSKHRIHCLHG